jgi:hypothetical protein
MKRLLGTVKHGILTGVFLAASAFSGLYAQGTPKQEPAPKPAAEQKTEAPAQEQRAPPIVGYPRPDAAIPGADSRMQLAAGKETGDFTGGYLAGRGRITLPGQGLSLSASIFNEDSDHDETKTSTEFLDFGGGFTQTTNITDTFLNKLKRSYSSMRGEYAGFGAQFSTSRQTREDLSDSFSDTLDGFGSRSTSRISTSQDEKLDTAFFALDYRAEQFHAALFGITQKGKNNNRTFDDFFSDSGGTTFTATIEDIAQAETSRTGYGASGSYFIVPDWFAGLDLMTNKIKRETATQYTEIQNGTVTASSSAADSETFNPLLVRFRTGYTSDAFPLSISAAAGYVTKTPQISDNGKENSQFIGDISALIRLGDSAGIYSVAGIDPEGEPFYAPALVFFDRHSQNRMHDFGRFAADQRTLFSDPASDDYALREHIHGLANYGWSIGALVHTGFDGIVPGDDIQHIKPFITGNIAQTNFTSIVADITDQGGAGYVRNVTSIDLGRGWTVDAFGEFGLRMLKDVQEELFTQEKASSMTYGFGLGAGRKF